MGRGPEPHRPICSEPREGAAPPENTAGNDAVVVVVVVVDMTTGALEHTGSVSAWTPAAGLGF